MLTVVQLNRGGDVEAAHAFEGAARALGRDPAIERIWPALVGLSPDPEQPQEALDRCDRGAVALLDGRLEEARHEAIKGMRYSPRFAWCAANLGEAVRRLGDLPRAEVLLRRAVEAYPDRQGPLRADARARLAAVLLDAARPAEAVPLAREALAERPDRAATLDVLARACDASGDVPCARDAYARLLARPHAPPAMRARAEGRLASLGAAAAPAPAR
jgi:predicted Zn-dependent protease